MKKCTYCAEEIQEEAIKCKHCGEWLPGPTEDTRSDRSDTSREEHKEKDKMDSIEKKSELTTQQTIDSTKNNEIPDVKPLDKKPGKYGWGWLIFYGLLANYGLRNDPFTDSLFSGIWALLSLLSLIPYFALRRRFLKRWEFPKTKPWKAGLSAGFCTYLLLSFVLGIMLFFDGRSLNKSIAQVDEKYNGKVIALKREEGQFTSRFIIEPKTQKDIEQNIQTIDELVSYNKHKKEFFYEMFNEYKRALENKKARNGKKSWNDSIDQILKAYDKFSETQQKAWLLLKNHYISGEETYYQDYTTTLQAASQLGTEYKKLVKETFGHS